MPTSKMRCPATFAAAAPMFASARRSSGLHNRSERKADDGRRSPSYPSRRPGLLAAHVSAGRSRHRRRPGAEYETAVCKPRSRSGRCRRFRAQRLHSDRRRWAGYSDHALCRDGPGHLHLHRNDDCRRAGGRPAADPTGTCAANEKLYGNPLLGGIQATGNSNAVRASWQPLRQAGAIARTMLISAAAKRWNVDPASCRAQSGEVLHASTGRRATYGELAADAARMPVPKNVALKRPEDFKLIGTPAKRLDTPAKVNGTAIYGIDARPPGVKIATLAQSPVFGGRVKRVDDTAAKAVKGVRQIVRLDDAVA